MNTITSTTSWTMRCVTHAEAAKTMSVDSSPRTRYGGQPISGKPALIGTTPSTCTGMRSSTRLPGTGFNGTCSAGTYLRRRSAIALIAVIRKPSPRCSDDDPRCQRSCRRTYIHASVPSLPSRTPSHRRQSQRGSRSHRLLAPSSGSGRDRTVTEVNWNYGRFLMPVMAPLKEKK